MVRLIWILALQLIVGAAWGADYAREKKWADEVTPAIVAGDSVYLEARNHKFLTLFTEAPNAKAALVIVHGLGVHPDWNLIGVLRTQLAALRRVLKVTPVNTVAIRRKLADASVVRGAYIFA